MQAVGQAVSPAHGSLMPGWGRRFRLLTALSCPGEAGGTACPTGLSCQSSA